MDKTINVVLKIDTKDGVIALGKIKKEMKGMTTAVVAGGAVGSMAIGGSGPMLALGAASLTTADGISRVQAKVGNYVRELEDATSAISTFIKKETKSAKAAKDLAEELVTVTKKEVTLAKETKEAADVVNYLSNRHEAAKINLKKHTAELVVHNAEVKKSEKDNKDLHRQIEKEIELRNKLGREKAKEKRNTEAANKKKGIKEAKDLNRTLDKMCKKMAKLNYEYQKTEHMAYAEELSRQNRKLKEQGRIIDRNKKKTNGFKQSLFGIRSYYLGITAAVTVFGLVVGKVFSAAFQSVDKFKLSVASTAAAITNFSDLSGGNVAEVYNNAKGYAKELALTMEVINTRTIATGAQLRAMSDTFIHHGVLLDINSKKEVEAFVAIANAVSLMTQGQNQEIQMRQEVRGLLSGDIRSTNVLARMIDTKLPDGLKKNLKLWRETDSVTLELGKHLKGFAAGSADLASTWAALKTTFQTIGERYLRGIFEPTYSTIIAQCRKITDSILNQETATKKATKQTKLLEKAWDGVKAGAKKGFETVGKTPKTLAWLWKGSMVKDVVDVIEPLGTEAATKFFIAFKLSMQGYDWGVIGRMVKYEYEEAMKETLVYRQKINVEKPDLENQETKEQKEKREALEAAASIALAVETSKARIALMDDEHLKALSLLNIAKKERIKKAKETGEDVLKIQDLFVLKRKKLTWDYIKTVEEATTAYKKKWIDACQKVLDKQKDLYKKHKADTETVLSYSRNDEQQDIHAIYEKGEAVKEAAKRAGFGTTALDEINAETTRRVVAYEKNTVQALKDSNEQIRKELLTPYEDWLETTKSMPQIMMDFNIQATESFASGSVDALWSFVDGTKSANRALKDFAASFGKELTVMLAKSYMLEGIKTLLGGTTAQERSIKANSAEAASVAALTSAYLALGVAKAIAGMGGGAAGGATSYGGASGFSMDNWSSTASSNIMGGYAKGGAFDQGKMMKYAKGGIVNSPTLFPMANGAGLMGEAGPEAVMPLKRTPGGKLGVETTGDTQQSSVTNITINAVDSQSFAEAIERNPGSIVNVIDEALKDNSGLNETIRSTT